MRKINQWCRNARRAFVQGIPPVIFAIAVISLFTPCANATIEQQKVYKEAFGSQQKPKCMHCHVDKLPKKGDGQHDLNEYGQKLVDVNEMPDVDTYKQVGPGEDAGAAGEAEE